MLTILVVKLTSCSGCINELIYALTHSDIRDKYRVAYFPEIEDTHELTSADVAFVEGSITTSHQEDFLKTVRSRVEFLVALGTCAISGGVQSLVVKESAERAIYSETRVLASAVGRPRPLDSAVRVDFAIPGCPVSGEAVVSFLRKYSLGGLPLVLYESVCSECKRRGVACVLVAKRVPCLGPITLSGCGALCPARSRGCYGCYGLKFFDVTRKSVRALARRLRELGLREEDFETLLLAYGYRVCSELR